MSAEEKRALWRAVALLVALSCVRWAWARSRPPVELAGPDVLAEVHAGSDSAAAELARRGRPLADGQRIDPNRASEVELDRLPGVGPATAAEIVRHRAARGAFRSAEDLLSVRGVGPATLRRVLPHLDLPAGTPERRAAARVSPAGRIDLNRADSVALLSLPGVGPALAGRILRARARGPFRDVEELIRVPGIGPATLDRVRARVTVGGPSGARRPRAPRGH